MSFLAEVIRSAEQVEMETISESVPEIKLKLDMHEKEVAKFIEKYYKNYEVTNVSNLIQTSEFLLNDMAKLKNQMDKVSMTNRQCQKNVQDLMQTVQETEIKLLFTRTLIEVHKELEVIVNFADIFQYKEAITKIVALRDKLETMPADSIASYVLPQVNKIETNVLKDLEVRCKENISMIKNNSETDYIAILGINLEHRYECVEAMYTADLHFPLSCATLYELCSFFMDEILNPMFVKSVTVETIESGTEFTLRLKVDEEENQDKKKPPSFESVVSKLKEIFTSLHLLLSSNKEDDSECPLMKFVSKRTEHKFKNMFINDCLAHTIPSTSEGLQKFESVVEMVQHFQDFLTDIEYFPKGYTPFTDYVRNVDSLYLEKKCQLFYENCLALMKKDLHDTLEVTVGGKETEDLERYHISKCCMELINLIVSMLKEYGPDTPHSDTLKEKVHCTVEAVFNQYPVTVKDYHAKLLESIPQQSALFHNNCLYLSYTIIHNEVIRLVKGRLQAYAGKLIKIGNDSFHTFVEEQQRQIENILKDSGLNSLQTADKLDASVEKSIRQCLRQQELLKTVWQKILSYHVYNINVGKLLSFFCQCLVDKVIIVTDISSTSAEQLVDIFNVVGTRGPKLLTDPKEINMYVEHWNRFKHLIMILSSSMVDICDQWADGKGPLALYFTAAEVQQLIRAIFQNTERRRNILVKITARKS